MRPGRRRMADRLMRALAGLLIHVFFRQVEVEGAENLPTDGPTVVVANHQNGLVDGLLLISALGRYPRFLGKSTLWKILPLRPFLALAGVIRVHRASDGEATGGNGQAFVTSRRLLANGGVVAVFPEGISHDETSLQPLRTGAARIALGAAGEDGTSGVRCVAVGLTYDAKSRFRSRALVRLAPAVEVGGWVEAWRADDHTAVRDLTDHLAEQLATVSPGFESWQQAEAMNRIAGLVGRPSIRPVPAEVALATQAEVARRLARMQGEEPQHLEALTRACEIYDRDVTTLGLTDAQASASYEARRVRRTEAATVAKVAVALLPALVGLVIHALPYQVVKRLARRPANEGIKATVKLLGCFVGFVLAYLVVGVLVGRRLGIGAGVGAFVAAPACGYVALRLAERIARLGGVLEGYRAFRDHPATMATAQADRREVVRLADEALAA